MQQTVLVALITGVLTAVTALTASWLTSRATTRAAQVHVISAAVTHRQERARELRRSAYVDLLVYATELRWRVRDLVTRASAGDETALTEFRASRNAIGSELERRCFVVYLEGPESVRESVDSLQTAINRLADGLELALQLENLHEIPTAVQELRATVRRENHHFMTSARTALQDTTPGFE